MFRHSQRWVTLGCLVALSRQSAAQSAEPVQEVVVEGNRVQRRSDRDPTANSSVLRRDDLSQPGLTTAGVVARVPGAEVRRSGSSTEPATLSLRGSTSAQVPVFLGPIALGDELSGQSDLALLPLFFVERIEVYRGHAPIFADRLGMGGALVIEPRLAKRTEWYGGLTIGSYGASSEFAGAAAGDARLSNLVGIQHTRAANDYPFVDNGGTVADATDDRRTMRKNADSETMELWNTGQFRPSHKTRLRWLLQGLERNQGVTGLSIIQASRARSHARRQLAALTATTLCGGSDRCSLELQTTWLHSSSGLDDPAFELGYGSTRIDSAATRVTQRLRLNHEITSGWNVGWLLGGDVGALDSINRGGTGLRAQRRSGLLGFNSAVRTSAALTLVALGRLALDRTDVDDGPLTSTNLPSGRVGLRYALLESLAVVANGGYYGGQPTLAELYGISATQRGNSDLQAERGYSEDIGLIWDWSLGRVQMHSEAIGYHQNTANLIAWQRASFEQIRPYNVGHARLLGAELSAAFGVIDAMRLEANASLLDPRDTTPGRQYVNSILPYRSRLTANVRAEAYLPRRLTPQGLRAAGLGATFFYRSSRYPVPAGNSVLASSATLDLDARLLLAIVPLTLRATVTNVVGRQNYDLLGMPLPGRAFFLGAEMHWEVTP